MKLFRILNRLKKEAQIETTRFVLVPSNIMSDYNINNRQGFAFFGKNNRILGYCIDMNTSDVHEKYKVDIVNMLEFFSDYYFYKLVGRGIPLMFVVSKTEFNDETFFDLKETLEFNSKGKLDFFGLVADCKCWHENKEIEVNYKDIRKKEFIYKKRKIKQLNSRIEEREKYLKQANEEISDFQNQIKEIYNTLSDEEKLLIELGGDSIYGDN